MNLLTAAWSYATYDRVCLTCTLLSIQTDTHTAARQVVPVVLTV